MYDGECGIHPEGKKWHGGGNDAVSRQSRHTVSVLLGDARVCWLPHQDIYGTVERAHDLKADDKVAS